MANYDVASCEWICTSSGGNIKCKTHQDLQTYEVIHIRHTHLNNNSAHIWIKYLHTKTFQHASIFPKGEGLQSGMLSWIASNYLL